MPLREELETQLKTAMRNRDTVSKDTIRYTLASLKNAEIDAGGPLSDQDAIQLLQREAKRRQDSIDQFRDAGRDDLVEREEAQLAVLQSFLPDPLDDEEIAELVSQVISETGASGPADMRQVMPLLVERAAGRAGGKALSSAASAQLTPKK